MISWRPSTSEEQIQLRHYTHPAPPKPVSATLVLPSDNFSASCRYSDLSTKFGSLKKGIVETGIVGALSFSVTWISIAQIEVFDDAELTWFAMIVILYVRVVLLATGATLLPCADEVASSIHR